jgi:hypothetical protein
VRLKPFKTSTVKKFIIWTILIVILFLGSYVYWKYYFTYSEGNRAGLLQKFSYRGNMFKTYEGELVMSSVSSSKDVTLASEKFYFSVIDKNVAAKFNSLEGHLVVLHYQQKNGVLPWRSETEYIVDSVRESR